jgi:hypothetical protein
MSSNGNEQVLLSAKANVLLYDDINKKWINSGNGPQGVSKVYIYQNVLNQTYRVVGRKVIDQEVVINCLLSKNIKIQKTPLFLQWRDSKAVYGLHFQLKEDAEQFNQMMVAAHEQLNKLAHATSAAAAAAQAALNNSTNGSTCNGDNKRNNNEFNNIYDENIERSNNNNNTYHQQQQQQQYNTGYNGNNGSIRQQHITSPPHSTSSSSSSSSNGGGGGGIGVNGLSVAVNNCHLNGNNGYQQATSTVNTSTTISSHQRKMSDNNYNNNNNYGQSNGSNPPLCQSTPIPPPPPPPSVPFFNGMGPNMNGNRGQEDNNSGKIYDIIPDNAVNNHNTSNGSNGTSAMPPPAPPMPPPNFLNGGNGSCSGGGTPDWKSQTTTSNNTQNVNTTRTQPKKQLDDIPTNPNRPPNLLEEIIQRQQQFEKKQKLNNNNNNNKDQNDSINNTPTNAIFNRNSSATSVVGCQPKKPQNSQSSSIPFNLKQQQSSQDIRQTTESPKIAKKISNSPNSIDSKGTNGVHTNGTVYSSSNAEMSPTSYDRLKQEIIIEFRKELQTMKSDIINSN